MLERRRDELAEQVAELHWDLGGLAYEMAIRDHFRLDVLMRRAAMLQECDAELAQVEQMLHSRQSTVAGNCPACGAVRSRGAVYCWQCGATLMEHSTDLSSSQRSSNGSEDSGAVRALDTQNASPRGDSHSAPEVGDQPTLELDGPPDAEQQAGLYSPARR